MVNSMGRFGPRRFGPYRRHDFARGLEPWTGHHHDQRDRARHLVPGALTWDMPEVPLPEALTALVGSDDVDRVRCDVVLAQIDFDSPPTDAIDAYLRLHLLSHRLAELASSQPDGLFRC